jgi:hypothetical protein
LTTQTISNLTLYSYDEQKKATAAAAAAAAAAEMVRLVDYSCCSKSDMKHFSSIVSSLKLVVRNNTEYRDDHKIRKTDYNFYNVLNSTTCVNI